MIRKKAGEKLKKEQELKAAERRKVIDHRCGHPKDVSRLSSGMFWQRYLKVYLVLVGRDILRNLWSWQLERKATKNGQPIREMNCASWMTL